MSDLKNKYNRVAQDASQLQQFVNEMIDKLNNTHGVHTIEKSGSNEADIEFTAEEMAMLRSQNELTIIKFHELEDAYDYWCFPILVDDGAYLYVGTNLVSPPVVEGDHTMYIRVCTFSFDPADPLIGTVDIRDLAAPTTEALDKKVNLIKLEDGESIGDVLDTVKTGDIVVLENEQAYLIAEKYSNFVTVFNVADDGLYFETYQKQNNAWTNAHSYMIATADYVNDKAGTKLYKHTIDINNSDADISLMFISTSSVNLFSVDDTLAVKLSKLGAAYYQRGMITFNWCSYNINTYDDSRHIVDLPIDDQHNAIGAIIVESQSFEDDLAGITITSLTDNVTEL